MFAADIGQEDLPLVVEELSQVFLFFITDRCKLDRVETELLEVHQVQVPRQEGQKIVQRDPRRAEEPMVVRVYRHFDAFGQKRACRMRSHVVHVAQDLV